MTSSYSQFSKYRFAYAFAIVVLATTAVAGSIWSSDNGQRETGNGQLSVALVRQ